MHVVLFLVATALATEPFAPKIEARFLPDPATTSFSATRPVLARDPITHPF